MTETTSFKPIYIIGDTPLADFLGVKLSLAGENVYRLGTHNQEPTQTYTLKEIETNQKYSSCLPSGNIMHHPAKMTILCLSSGTLKADLAYFSSAKNNTAPVISFCREDPELLNKLIRNPIIPAYFSGFLGADKNHTLLFAGAPNGITLSISEQHPFFYDIRQTLAKTDLDLHFSEDNLRNFWHNFIPDVISALFLLQSNYRFRDIPKKNELRILLSNLIDELNSILPENYKYDKGELTSYIYALPNSYEPPLICDLRQKNKKELSFILSILQKQSSFNSTNCPITFKTLRELLHNLLSPVE